MPHLAGFFPGFIVMVTYSLYLISRRGHPFTKARLFRRSIFWTVAASYAAYILSFYIFYEDSPNTHIGKYVEFKRDKGVDLLLTEQEYKKMEAVTSTVTKMSRPKDFVLCFPYCPGILFLADRSTFQYYLYVDDALPIAQPNWLETMKAQIIEKQPKVIVIEDWKINATEISRFQNWAKPLYDQINSTYTRELNENKVEVFVRR
jgi:hypothetical protein